jgi:hypothetical protein
MQAEKAAAAVMESWKRMTAPTGPVSSVLKRENQDQKPSTALSDMIYHAQPWSIACNLTGDELSLDDCNWPKYQKILSRHQLV